MLSVLRGQEEGILDDGLPTPHTPEEMRALGKGLTSLPRPHPKHGTRTSDLSLLWGVGGRRSGGWWADHCQGFSSSFTYREDGRAEQVTQGVWQSTAAIKLHQEQKRGRINTWGLMKGCPIIRCLLRRAQNQPMVSILKRSLFPQAGGEKNCPSLTHRNNP